jgi:probable rRNA maturation factor
VPELDVEVLGDALDDVTVHRLVTLALASAGIEAGHIAVQFVDAARIAELNAEHRGIQEPTDVLSFPVDELGEAHGGRELGDVIICPEYTADLAEAVVHGTLHLVGMDHETDQGQMLVLQREILSW